MRQRVDRPVCTIDRPERARLLGAAVHPLGAGHGKKNVFPHYASKPLLFGFARTAIFPEQTLATAHGLASGLGSRRNWSRLLAGTYTEHISTCEWPGDARHAARRFS